MIRASGIFEREERRYERERRELDRILAPVYAEINGRPPLMLTALGRGLLIADRDGEFQNLGNALIYADKGVSPLTEIELRRWLRISALRGDTQYLIDRLEHAHGALGVSSDAR